MGKRLYSALVVPTRGGQCLTGPFLASADTAPGIAYRRTAAEHPRLGFGVEDGPNPCKIVLRSASFRGVLS